MTTRKLSVLGGLMCMIITGCSQDHSSQLQQAAESIKINALEPSSTSEAQAFKVRPDGNSALVVFGTNIPSAAEILWNDQQMKTSGGGAFVIGAIPPRLYQSPGTARITLRNGDTVSNPLDFTIYGKSGPSPEINAVSPASAVAGVGFSVQPGGDSAIGIAGTGFLPGCAVMVDGKQMQTVFGRDTFISAVIPKSLIAHPGSHQILVANLDGKMSNKIPFNVQ